MLYKGEAGQYHVVQLALGIMMYARASVLSHFRSGSRIPGKGLYMYNGVGFALLILPHFLQYPMKMK